MPTTSSVSRLRSALNRPATASPADAGVDGVELLQSKPSTRRGSADHHSAFYLEALGEDTLSLDAPMIIHGIDVGTSPTPLEEAQAMAADA